MQIKNWEVPDTAFDCVCGCRPKGCEAVSGDKREAGFYIEHFGCRMNTIRFSDSRKAVNEWNRIVQLKLAETMTWGE